MARIGYIYSAGTPGAGQAQAFRNFLASNLTSWTVGSVYTFDSGTAERNYFTLTSSFGGEEILVIMPNGNNEDLLSSVDNTLAFSSQVSTSTDQTLSLMLALDGGFETRLAAGDDPDVDTGTFYPSRVTRVTPLQFWSEIDTDATFYVIEDDASAGFFIYTGKTSSNNGYSYWGYSDAQVVFDLVPNDPAFTFVGSSVVQLQCTTSTANSPRPVVDSYQWFHYTGQTETYLEQIDPVYATANFLQNLESNHQPSPEDGSFITARAASLYTASDVDYTGFIGQINPAIMRQFVGITSGYRRKFTASSGEVFINVFESLLTPWAGNLGDPS